MENFLRSINFSGYNLRGYHSKKKTENYYQFFLNQIMG